MMREMHPNQIEYTLSSTHRAAVRTESLWETEKKELLLC
jgi:hypothetical protein